MLHGVARAGLETRHSDARCLHHRPDVPLDRRFVALRFSVFMQLNDLLHHPRSRMHKDNIHLFERHPAEHLQPRRSFAFHAKYAPQRNPGKHKKMVLNRHPDEVVENQFAVGEQRLRFQGDVGRKDKQTFRLALRAQPGD